MDDLRDLYFNPERAEKEGTLKLNSINDMPTTEIDSMDSHQSTVRDTSEKKEVIIKQPPATSGKKKNLQLSKGKGKGKKWT